MSSVNERLNNDLKYFVDTFQNQRLGTYKQQIYVSALVLQSNPISPKQVRHQMTSDFG